VTGAAAGQRVAIFGATSGIAIATARRLADQRARIVLIGRDREATEALTGDLRVRGAAAVQSLEADFTQVETLQDIVARAWGVFSGLDVALIAYGSLPDQQQVDADATLLASAICLNFTSPAFVAQHLAARFEAAGSGTIAVITSVAGDRGRKSNYLYGAAKGGLQRFLQGLRHRLHAAGVQVLDIRPGFVRTRMTAHLAQTGPLWATPDHVAADIVRAVARRRAVLYTPGFWRIIMAIVRALPRPIFHRTSL